MVQFAEQLTQGIHSVCFGGHDRNAVVVAALALVRRVGPTVF